MLRGDRCARELISGTASGRRGGHGSRRRALLVSKSESTALDVFRKAWVAAGNQWADMPARNKVEVQRIASERVTNGYAPAVMQWNANEGSRELPEMGIVLDIEQVARDDNWCEILPAAVLDRITYDGKSISRRPTFTPKTGSGQVKLSSATWALRRRRPGTKSSPLPTRSRRVAGCRLPWAEAPGRYP